MKRLKVKAKVGGCILQGSCHPLSTETRTLEKAGPCLLAATCLHSEQLWHQGLNFRQRWRISFFGQLEIILAEPLPFSSLSLGHVTALVSAGH